MKQGKGRIEFECNDILLERGFYWAKAMALSYVHENDPVGDWYEASLPGRDAFCMRDVAHYAVGAQLLGLQSHNKNMLQKFVQGMAESRDFCSFWEITKNNLPASGDYTDDQDFWYNLPANFDILQICWQLFCWTDDHDYLHHPDFNRFYNATVQKYIQTWDKNGDGFPERAVAGSRRGIPSYEERDEYRDALMMGDLIALQAKAFDAYALIHRMKGNDYLYDEYTAKAADIRSYYDKAWWNADRKRFHSVMLKDGTFAPLSEQEQDLDILPFYYGLIQQEEKKQIVLNRLKDCQSEFIEYLSYLPEIFYAYHEEDEAHRCLLALTHPDLKRREYPEISYAVVGTVGAGLMGIKPNAERRSIKTQAGFSANISRAKMSNIPVFSGEIDLEHIGKNNSIIKNRTGNDIWWQPSFVGEFDKIAVNGKEIEAEKETNQSRVYSSVKVLVENGHTAEANTTIEKGMG